MLTRKNLHIAQSRATLSQQGLRPLQQIKYQGLGWCNSSATGYRATTYHPSERPTLHPGKIKSTMVDAEVEKKGVRFAGEEEPVTAPDGELRLVQTLTNHQARSRADFNEETEQELQRLKTQLKNNIQSQRMQHHNFEPVSLPGSTAVSRVPSNVAAPPRRMLAGSAGGSRDTSPKRSPVTSAVHSPPLTPAATHTKDGKTSAPVSTRPVPDIMTPQRSITPPKEKSDATETKTTSAAPVQSTMPSSTLPPQPYLGTSRPTTPRTKSVEDMNFEERYRFGNRDPAQGWANSGMSNVPVPSITPASKSSLSASSTSTANKRASFFGGIKKTEDEPSHSTEKPEKHHSKSNLKRFFNKFGDHKKDKDKDHAPAVQAPAAETPKPTPKPLPSMVQPSASVPFADDHGLQTKYGKFGRVLGQGAGGSVRLMKRTGDGVVFAVKQFRDRHSYESEREYNKKVTAEFCIGSTLHHGNVIETIDIIHEKGKWYEVMEYAPYDLFATVMTGKMGREEITCATLQILSGVCYLHQMGLAHRDLKLDNVVISSHGIMKLIDFGSAVVFRYPFENEIVLATGVVGSDPYLAPEVYDGQRYDPRLVDVWSIAIIFCCMTLRRFPWKAPRLTDNSYRLFVAEPDADHEKAMAQYTSSAKNKRDSDATIDLNAQEADKRAAEAKARDDTRAKEGHHHHHHHSHHHTSDTKSEPVSRQSTAASDAAVIKGPLRLLRLLPRETRHIIGRMLTLNPKDRADMDEILEDPWVQNALVCRQEENGTVFSAPNHKHTLQPSGGSSTESK
ncbi:hypothetical protein AMS68_004518 [Peltaster fructicola]|uniref:non-specific serine/threonine protein kinase n=1 Tax=Peltaster fructicola TaxID=286661 RepID=A0A6H0XWG1_9PEZI|nr:hypothetical protein AMS68_004518 [Peltaster fructicola]